MQMDTFQLYNLIAQIRIKSKVGIFSRRENVSDILVEQLVKLKENKNWRSIYISP